MTKPGIIYGNVMTTLGGFLFASRWHIAFLRLAGVLVGTALVIAAACIYNNYLDRGLDKHMKRTSRRALVTGVISGRQALSLATILAACGFGILASCTNLATVIVGAVGLVFYVLAYGYFKRHSVHGTLVGSISGAAPVVAGYTAFTGRFDLGALLLFVILAAWQMPHFYAIAMYRATDYRAAGVPVLPVQKGMAQTKLQIMAYIVVFVGACGLLTVKDYAGYTFAAVMAALGIFWFYRGLSSYKSMDNVLWGRKMFFTSLIVILGLSVMLSFGSILA